MNIEIVKNASFKEFDASIKKNASYEALVEQATKIAQNNEKTPVFYKVLVPLSAIAFDTESYNEVYLANLREIFKIYEECDIFCIISPVFEGFVSAQNAMDFIEAFKHCARRIKDCRNVLGFEIPECFSKLQHSNEFAKNFTAALSEKHPHYIFAAKNGFYKEIANFFI